MFHLVKRRETGQSERRKRWNKDKRFSSSHLICLPLSRFALYNKIHTVRTLISLNSVLLLRREVHKIKGLLIQNHIEGLPNLRHPENLSWICSTLMPSYETITVAYLLSVEKRLQILKKMRYPVNYTSLQSGNELRMSWLERVYALRPYSVFLVGTTI